MNTTIRHCAATIAASLLALPALADTTLPGTFCSADGATGKSLTGLMVNKVPTPSGQATTTYFHCPIIRTQGIGFNGTVTVTLNVKTNPSNAEFNCYMRSVSANNMTFDNSKVVFASSYYNNGYTVGTFVVSLPAIPAAVNMRCSVPDVMSGVEAGIVSYRIEQ